MEKLQVHPQPHESQTTVSDGVMSVVTLTIPDEAQPWSNEDNDFVVRSHGCTDLTCYATTIALISVYQRRQDVRPIAKLLLTHHPRRISQTANTNCQFFKRNRLTRPEVALTPNLESSCKITYVLGVSGVKSSSCFSTTFCSPGPVPVRTMSSRNYLQSTASLFPKQSHQAKTRGDCTTRKRGSTIDHGKPSDCDIPIDT